MCILTKEGFGIVNGNYNVIMHKNFRRRKFRPLRAIILLVGLVVIAFAVFRYPSWTLGRFVPAGGTTLAAPDSGAKTPDPGAGKTPDANASGGAGQTGAPELPEAFRNGVTQDSVSIVTTTTPAPGNRRNPADIVARLSFLKPPLEGLKVPTYRGQLAGAPRQYRNGIHQGFDFYSGYAGIIINKKTPALAAADGTIIRIDHDYREMTMAERDKILSVVKTGGSPMGKDLDWLHGRQVWILHQNGVVTRYSHLSAVEPELKVGDLVKAGTVVGRVGNSGTDSGALANDEDVHLDFEIFIDQKPFWDGLTPAEAREVLAKVFDQK